MWDAEILGFLMIRLGLGYIYLWAAYQNTRDEASWNWTIDHTAILFEGTTIKDDRRLMKLFATIGMLVMYGGGFSILLGVEARLGALALALFTVAGAVIHNREKNMALGMGETLASHVDEAGAGQLNELAWSAFAGHHSSALKNWGLALPLLFLVAVGAGPDSIVLSDEIGAWLGL